MILTGQEDDSVDKRGRETDIRTRFGHRLAEFRQRAKITQEELAHAAGGLSRIYVCHVEQGRKAPSLDTLIRLARGLRTSIPSLVDFESVIVPPSPQERLAQLVLAYSGGASDEDLERFEVLVRTLLGQPAKVVPPKRSKRGSDRRGRVRAKCTGAPVRTLKPSVMQTMLGQRLVALREEAGKSQSEVATDALGMSAAHVSNLERGLKRPSIETLERIATALGKSLPEVLDFTNKDLDDTELVPLAPEERLADIVASCAAGASLEDLQRLENLVRTFFQRTPSF